MESIGQTLKAAREQKNLTLGQVAAALKTKTQTLQALEADNFGALAAPVYVRGFIKLYAEHVGLAAAPLLKAYTEMTGGACVRRHVAAVLKKEPDIEDLTGTVRPPPPWTALWTRLADGARSLLQAAADDGSGGKPRANEVVRRAGAGLVGLAVLVAVIVGVIQALPARSPALSTKARWVQEPPDPYLETLPPP